MNMQKIEELEKRWKELLKFGGGDSKSKSELEQHKIEVSALSSKMALERAKEHKELTSELASVGVFISTIWDLVNTKTKYTQAIPILLKHLVLEYSDKTKEGIVRALTVIEAKGLAGKLLIGEYLKLSYDKENFKWAIGNAVKLTMVKDEVELVFPIVLDKNNGISRQMFIRALSKFKTENVKQVLLQLVNEEDKVISEEATKALRKFK